MGIASSMFPNKRRRLMPPPGYVWDARPSAPSEPGYAPLPWNQPQFENHNGYVVGQPVLSIPNKACASAKYATAHVDFGYSEPDPSLFTNFSFLGERPLEALRVYDIIFVIDDSYSMFGDHWFQTGKVLKELAIIATRYDKDGIDVYFLNHTQYGGENMSADQVMEAFNSIQPQPNSYSPVGDRLDRLTRPYLGDLEKGHSLKPRNYIVITDGLPSDGVREVILGVAERLDEGDFPLSQLGIQFLQIGNNLAAAAELGLLDDLGKKNKVRDIVDTVLYQPKPGKLGFSSDGTLHRDFVLKAFLGSINRKLDEMSTTIMSTYPA